jgi:DNA-binding response OmpR family regulator
MMKRILLVEDEPHIVRLMTMALEHAGYAVDSASNGEEALQCLEDQHPDILITDIDMPRMTGQELCTRLNAELPERDFLIIVITARTEVEHREWSGVIPNLEFREKPISVRKLVARLDEYFADTAVSEDCISG